MKLLKPLVLAPIALASTLVAVACSDDPATIGDPDASTSDATTGGDSSEGADSSVDSGLDFDQDGGLVLDGGDISEGDGGLDDGGLVDFDAGFDAGPSCSPLPPKTVVASVCSSTKVAFFGGTIAAGTYDIEAVTVHADAATCASVFKTANYKAVLDVAQAGGNAYTMKFAQIVGAPNGGVARGARYDLDAVTSVANISLTPKAPCVGNASTRNASYSAGKSKVDLKDRLSLTFPIGASGTATYRFVRRP